MEDSSIGDKFCEIGRSHSIATNFDSTDEENEGWGIIFDFFAFSDFAINSLNLNIEKKIYTNIGVFLREGTHYGHESDASSWEGMGVYSIITRGEGNPTPLVFDESIKIKKGLHSFYLVQADRDDIKYYDKNDIGFGYPDISDRHISILVGTGRTGSRGGSPFATQNTNIRGKGFSGSINYSLCQHDENKPTNFPSMPTNLPTLIPTRVPTRQTTYTPTRLPIYSPSDIPTSLPIYLPSASTSSSEYTPMPTYPSLPFSSERISPLSPQKCSGSELSSSNYDASREISGAGIFFNIITTRNEVFVHGFDLNIGMADKTELSVYTRVGNYEDFEMNNFGWIFLGTYVASKNKSSKITRIDLSSAVKLSPNSVQAMLLLLDESEDLKFIQKKEEKFNDLDIKDEYIALSLGTGIRHANPIERLDGYRVGFKGKIRYSICDLDGMSGSDSPTPALVNKLLPQPQTFPLSGGIPGGNMGSITGRGGNIAAFDSVTMTTVTNSEFSLTKAVSVFLLGGLAVLLVSLTIYLLRKKCRKIGGQRRSKEGVSAEQCLSPTYTMGTMTSDKAKCNQKDMPKIEVSDLESRGEIEYIDFDILSALTSREDTEEEELEVPEEVENCVESSKENSSISFDEEALYW